MLAIFREQIDQYPRVSNGSGHDARAIILPAPAMACERHRSPSHKQTQTPYKDGPCPRTSSVRSRPESKEERSLFFFSASSVLIGPEIVVGVPVPTAKGQTQASLSRAEHGTACHLCRVASAKMTIVAMSDHKGQSSQPDSQGYTPGPPACEAATTSFQLVRSTRHNDSSALMAIAYLLCSSLSIPTTSESRAVTAYRREPDFIPNLRLNCGWARCSSIAEQAIPVKSVCSQDLCPSCAHPHLLKPGSAATLPH